MILLPRTAYAAHIHSTAYAIQSFVSIVWYRRDSTVSAAMLFKAKFHYAIWFEAGSKLVADRFEAGRRQASNMSATIFEPASVMESGF